MINDYLYDIEVNRNLLIKPLNWYHHFFYLNKIFIILVL